jgi:hypothetical protein
MLSNRLRDTLLVMTSTYTPGEVVYGAPRNLPTILLCQADVNFCGRHWIANTWEEYDERIKERYAHENFCGTRPNAAGLLTALTPADRQALLVAKR